MTHIPTSCIMLISEKTNTWRWDMCRGNYTTEEKKGKHLKLQDREIIEHLYNIQGKTAAEIARELGKHRTTISRELEKGIVHLRNSDYTQREEYVAQKGQEVYDNNATAKGPKIKIAKDYKLADFIEKKITKDKYSPEVIANIVKRKQRFKINLHWKTIYNYIDKEIIMVDRDDLTYGNYSKSQGSKRREKESTKRRKEGRRISDRPREAEERKKPGHWEMDLVEGKKAREEPFLLVLTERCSRNEQIEKIPDKTQQAVIAGLDRIERRMGVKKFRTEFKTITTDNGKEFYDYEGIETSFTKSSTPRTKQYYADAYCSWQRGSNENLNKMIRRFIPKGTSLKQYSQKAIKDIQKWMNNYPRKMFGFMSSKEVYQRKLKAI